MSRDFFFFWRVVRHGTLTLPPPVALAAPLLSCGRHSDSQLWQAFGLSFLPKTGFLYIMTLRRGIADLELQFDLIRCCFWFAFFCYRCPKPRNVNMSSKLLKKQLRTFVNQEKAESSTSRKLLPSKEKAADATASNQEFQLHTAAPCDRERQYEAQFICFQSF